MVTGSHWLRTREIFRACEQTMHGRIRFTQLQVGGARRARTTSQRKDEFSPRVGGSSSKRTGLSLAQHSHTFDQRIAILMQEEFVVPVAEFLPRQCFGDDPQVSLPGLSNPPTPVAPPSNPLRMSSFLSPKFGAQPTHSPGNCQDFSNSLLVIELLSCTRSRKTSTPRHQPAS